MNWITYWILRVLAFLCLTPMLLAMKAYWIAEGMREKKERKIVPVREALTGPSAPEGYIEPPRTRELRSAYVARRATREEVLAAEDHNRAMALIRDAGGC